MTQQNNESAFPWGDYEGLKAGQSGMSKRFYAACKAMEAMMMDKLHPNDKMIKGVIKDAYRIADEMLKQENEK